MIAAQKGHKEIVQHLLAAGAEVNPVNDKRHSPLLYAAEKGHTEIVKILIEAGGNVECGVSLLLSMFE